MTKRPSTPNEQQPPFQSDDEPPMKKKKLHGEKLATAARFGNLETITELMELPVEERPTQEHLHEAFLRAVRASREDVAKQLILQHQANVCYNDDEAIRTAMGSQRLDMVKLLLSHGANGNAVIPFIADIADLETMEALVQYGADIHGGNDEMLWRVSDHGRTDLLEFLLDHHADVDGNAAKRALASAVKFARVKCIQLLLARGVNVRANNDAVLQSVFQGRIKLVLDFTDYYPKTDIGKCLLSYYSSVELDELCDNPEFRGLSLFIREIQQSCALDAYANVKKVRSVLQQNVLENHLPAEPETAVLMQAGCLTKDTPLPLRIIQAVTSRECDIDIFLYL